VADTAIPPAPNGGYTYAYSLEEITRMLLVLPEPAATLVATAGFTGARRGEIRGMRWEKYHDGAIYIDRSVWESHITEPKTKPSKAPIPIIPTLVAMLQRHRERLGNPMSGVMFPASNGKPVSLNKRAEPPNQTRAPSGRYRVARLARFQARAGNKPLPSGSAGENHSGDTAPLESEHHSKHLHQECGCGLGDRDENARSLNVR